MIPKKNTITVPFDQFGYYVVAKMVYSFTDITSHPYARNYLEAIFSKGVMNAANFDDFGADMYTTRGEFTRMVVKALIFRLTMSSASLTLMMCRLSLTTMHYGTIAILKLQREKELSGVHSHGHSSRLLILRVRKRQ